MRGSCKLFLFVLLLTATCTTSSAQVTVTGSVTDATTGEALPAANIRVSGTYTGTISNADGAFRLVLSRVPATIVFRYIGYTSDSIRVSRSQDVQIRLQESPIEMSELLVTDENRAIEVMRRVIARKKRMNAVLERYSVDAYNRFTLANDTGVVSVMETVTEAYWDKKEGTREVIKMERKTNNVDFGGLPAAMLVSNLSADNVEISGFEFVGVTNPRALSVYDFQIERVLSRDGDLVYEISVAPKARTSVGFVGFITVLDSEAVMLSADLEPGDAFRFPPPVQSMAVAMQQQYDEFADSLWLPVDFRSVSVIRLGVAGLFEIPTVEIKQVSRLQNYNVNGTSPLGLFEDNQQVQTDTLSVQANKEIPDSLSVPLVAVEAMAYRTVDSTMTLQEAYKPTGRLARFVNARVSGGNDAEDERQQTGRSLLRPSVEPIALFNRVDGFKIGGRPSVSVGRATLSGAVAYSTALTDGRWSGDVGVEFGGALGGGARWFDQTEKTYQSLTQPTVVNTATMLLGGTDYFDYYRRKGLDLHVEYQLEDLEARVSFRHEQHESLMASTNFDLLGNDRVQPPNPVISPGTLRSIAVDIRINPPGAPLAIAGSRSLRVQVEHAPSLASSDFEFTTIKGHANWTQPTFGQRRLFPATLDLRLVASVGMGSVPRQRLAVLDVSDWPFATSGSFRTAGSRPYAGEHNLALFWEHNFRTIPFELVGLSSIADRNYGIIIFGAHGSSELQSVVSNHHELGVSLTGLFGLLRLDAAKRLDDDGYGIGFGVTRFF